MEFSDLTNHKIELLDSVLRAIGVSSLFENPDFKIDEGSKGFHNLIINVYSDERITVPLAILIEGDGLRVDVCGLDEAFEWPDDYVFTARQEIVDFFYKLFTSYVLIETCGPAWAKTRMYLFGTDGQLLCKHGLRGFFQGFSGWDCDKTLYFPLYKNQGQRIGE